MKLKKGPSGEKFPRIEDGTYLSRIVQIIGLGSHERDDRYPEKGTCDKVLITCEYPTEMITINGEDLPRFQSKQENMFLTDKANLVKIIKAAIPEFDLEAEDDFDFYTLLGKSPMTTIGSTSTGNPKIVSFTPEMKGMPCPPQISESIMFDFYEPDLDTFNGLMQWVQDLIKEADNYPGSALQELVENRAKASAGMEPDSEVPF